MIRYKELYINCSEAEARSFFVRLTTALQSPRPLGYWRRDGEAMANMEDDFCFKRGLFICVAMLNGDAKPEASVTLVFDEHKSQIWLSNIVPSRIGQLSVGEYNRIFDDVLNHVIRPSIHGLHCTVTSDTYSGRDVLSAESWGLLESFSSMANRGSLHPLDFERWHAFVISVYNAPSDSRLESSTLKKILKEELGWDDSGSSELVSLFEDEIDLLKKYDEHLKSVKR